MKLTLNKLSITLGAVLIAGIGGYAINAIAHGGATGIVKERMDLMSNIGKAQKSLVAMFSGKEPYNIQKVQQAAIAIENHAGERISKLFPEGTTQKPSEALPTIWKNWSEFQHLSNELAVFAGALAKNAGNKGGNHDTNKKGSMMTSSTMMGQSGMGSSSMMGGSSGVAGSGKSVKAQVEMLTTMPPMASFQRVALTCTTCHTKFRMKKK